MQDRGSAQTAMGEEQRFLKRGLAVENFCRDRDTGKRAQPFKRCGIKRQRHEARTSFDELEAELFGDLVGETGRAHFRDRLAARRHNEAFRFDDAGGCRDAKTPAIMGDGRD